MADKLMESCSPSLAVREMQTETTVRPPHTHWDGCQQEKWKIASIDEDVEKWELHAQLVAVSVVQP